MTKRSSVTQNQQKNTQSETAWTWVIENPGKTILTSLFTLTMILVTKKAFTWLTSNTQTQASPGTHLDHGQDGGHPPFDQHHPHGNIPLYLRTIGVSIPQSGFSGSAGLLLPGGTAHTTSDKKGYFEAEAITAQDPSTVPANTLLSAHIEVTSSVLRLKCKHGHPYSLPYKTEDKQYKAENLLDKEFVRTMMVEGLKEALSKAVDCTDCTHPSTSSSSSSSSESTEDDTSHSSPSTDSINTGNEASSINLPGHSSNDHQEIST